MDLFKTNWLADGNNVKVLVPISKIDEERRQVSGFASLNNVDQHDDVVTLECSVDAFARFRGNIREMHQPIAAGKMLSFSVETYYDEATGAAYEGIYVTAYVSKGAQDTWEKVLDSTLSGFSIGGYVEDSHSEYIPDIGKTIRFITKMTLFELSLVDNPANQLANVLSISKVGDEIVAKGIAADVETQNVFWCESDRLAVSISDETAKCRQCESEMTNIGWIEVTDAAPASAELKKFMDSWTEKVITAQQIKEQTSESVQQNSEFANAENIGDNNTETAEKSEGGVEDMSDVETVEKAAEIDEVIEAAPTEEVEKAADAEAAEEVVEKAADAEEEVVEKAADEAVEETSPVAETVEKSEDAAPAAEEVDLTEVVKALSSITDTLVALSEKVTASSEAAATLTETVKSVNESLENVSGRLDNLEKATATKKSGNDEDSVSVTKGFSWNGHFASASSIVN